MPPRPPHSYCHSLEWHLICSTIRSPGRIGKKSVNDDESEENKEESANDKWTWLEFVKVIFSEECGQNLYLVKPAQYDGTSHVVSG